MSFSVTLIRHGETDFNLKNLVHTISDDTINETGKEQAHKLGLFLSGRTYTKAFSSDLQRCQDTAKGVFKNSRQQPVPELVLDKRLRERSFGQWDGRPMMDIIKMAKEEKRNVMDISAPDGETYKESADRIINFFQDLLKIRDESESAESVIIFTHGLMIQALMRHLHENREIYDLENFEFQAMKFSTNTARTELTIEKQDNGKRKLVFSCMHDVSHL